MTYLYKAWNYLLLLVTCLLPAVLGGSFYSNECASEKWQHFIVVSTKYAWNVANFTVGRPERLKMDKIGILPTR